MADRTTSVRLQANVEQFQRAMAAAQKNVLDVTKELRGLGSASEKTARELQPLGTAALAVGSSIAVAGGLAVKAAIDFESAFAGVAKTVDGTTAEMARLSDGIREMSREVPTSALEIAGVAEAAGALGVETNSILGFTRVMIDMGETTNLTADQAATSFARIANIMGTAHSEFDRMGSVVVDLGNNGASTEAEIVELANRLAAAGKIAGLTEANVFAFAETLASVGVEAEAGGTALSKVFTSVRDAVLDGSDKLNVFAEVAGTSTQAFAAAFREDAAVAIASFVEGLGRISDAGQSTTGVFEALELTDQRLMRALQSTGSAGEYLRNQIGLANSAWSENNALSEEAAKRYETTAAQLEILRNNLVDIGVELGNVFLPAIAGSADALGLFLDGIRDMPGPLQAVAVGAGGLTGAVTLLGGGFLFMLPRIQETIRAWRTLSTQAPTLTSNLKRASVAVGGVTIALAAASYVYGENARKKAELTQNTDDFIAALREEREGVEGATRALIIKKLEENGLLEAGRAAGLGVNDLVKAVLGEKDALQESVAAMGDKAGALIALAKVQAAAIESDERLTAAQQEFQYSGRGSADTMDRLARASDRATGAIGDQEDAIGGVIVAVDDYSDALDALLGTTFGVQGATDQLVSDVFDLAQSVADARAEGDDFAASLDASTESGLRNRQALRGIVEGALDVADAMVAAGEDPVPAMQMLHASLIDTLRQLGFNETEAKAYIDVLLQVPGSVATKVQLETDEAMAKLNAYIARLLAIPTDVRTAIDSAELHDSIRFRNQQGLGAAPTGSLATDISGIVGSVTPSSGGGSTAEQMRSAADQRKANEWDFGGITTDEYKRYLAERIVATEAFTDEWVGLMREQQRVNDAIGDGWRAAADEIARLEELWMETLRRQNEVGDLSDQAYLASLETRLAGLEKYSDEWMEVWREINQLKDEVDGNILDIIAAVEKQRQFDIGFYGSMDQRELSASREPTVVVQGGSSSSFSPTFQIASTSPDRDVATASQRMREYAYLNGFS